MKKNSIFFLMIAFTVSLLSQFSVFGQEKSGFYRCSSLISLLERYDYFPVTQNLLENSSADYPFNLILQFDADNNLEPDNDSFRDFIHTLILNFSVKDVISDFPLFMDILDAIKNSSRNGAILVVISYGDEEASKDPHLIAGTQVFTENGSTESAAAIAVSFSDETNTIIPGSGGDCSPAWLIQLLTGSLYDSGLHYVFRGGILSSLYRLNFLKDDFRTGMFMMNDIPACGLHLKIQETDSEYRKKISNFFSQLAGSFDPETTGQWDRHSRPFQIFNRTFIVTERFSISFFLISSIISLFLICQFSFIVSFSRRNIRKSVLRLWPLIPACALLTTIAFFAAQLLASFISGFVEIEPVFFIIVKLAAGFIIISIAFFFLIRINGIYSGQVYAYLMTITGLINIFLFSAVDISLFYLFLIEYVIINLGRPFRKTAALIPVFFILAVPLMPYIIQFLTFAEPKALTRILFMPFLPNLIFAFGFMPFEFIWLRILSRLNTRWRLTSRKKKIYLKQNLIAIGSAIGIFIVILIVITAFIPDEYKIRQNRKGPETTEDENNSIEISYRDEDFYGDTIRTIKIRLSETEENVKVFAEGKNSVPVLYSEELLMSEPEKHRDYFRLPAWPPEEMTFSYICDTYDDSEIIVQIDKTDGKTGNSCVLQKKIHIAATSTGEEN